MGACKDARPRKKAEMDHLGLKGCADVPKYHSRNVHTELFQAQEHDLIDIWLLLGEWNAGVGCVGIGSH